MDEIDIFFESDSFDEFPWEMKEQERLAYERLYAMRSTYRSLCKKDAIFFKNFCKKLEVIRKEEVSTLFSCKVRKVNVNLFTKSTSIDGTTPRRRSNVRGSNSKLTSDLPTKTPSGIFKRSSTTSKDRCRRSCKFTRRYSDVSGVLERQVGIDQKRKEAEEAELYLEKVVISDRPALEILWDDGYDAVIVDVGATGLPISATAKAILYGNSAADLHKICMSNPYKNGVLPTPKGTPDIIYIASDTNDAPDKRVRIGMATGMREAFEKNGQLKKVLAYPFCVPEDPAVADFVIYEFLLTSYKALTWAPEVKNFDGTITLAGVTYENCIQMRRLHEKLVAAEVRPRIQAYATLPCSTNELNEGGNVEEF